MMHMNFSGPHNNWLCGPGAFFPGPFGMILTLLFWGLIIYVVIKVVQALLRPKASTPSSHLDILKKRYANGEIDEATYLKMKEELTSQT